MLAALLVLLAASSAFAPALRLALYALDLLVLAAVAADFFLARAPAGLVPERRVLERVRLGVPFERELLLAGGRARQRFELHEEFPASFTLLSRALEGQAVAPRAEDPSGGPDAGHLDGAGRARVLRRYLPGLRGRFVLGDLRLRVWGPLGLVARQARFAGAQALAVEPALLRLRETLRLAASDRWRDLGVRRLRRPGVSSEFESLREYVHGDEVRRVDWKASARRAKPMVRNYQLERGQELLILVDCGRRMRAAEAEGAQAGWTKLDWALDAALELAAVALSKGDRVGVAGFERDLVAYVPPARGRRAQASLTQALFPLQPSAREADLARALKALAVRHRRRATVLVLSDVADPLSLEEQRAALAAASRRHRLVFAALDDPSLRRAAETYAEDPVCGAAALELASERRRSLRVLATSGARVLDAVPAEAAAPLLAAWLEERRRG